MDKKSRYRRQPLRACCASGHHQVLRTKNTTFGHEPKEKEFKIKKTQGPLELTSDLSIASKTGSRSLRFRGPCGGQLGVSPASSKIERPTPLKRRRNTATHQCRSRQDARNGEMVRHTGTVVAVPSQAHTRSSSMGVAWSIAALILIARLAIINHGTTFP
jgi:hypothetical protein